MTSPSQISLLKCCFIDSLNGWAAGDSNIILRTTNSGQDWSIQNYSEGHRIVDLCMINQRLGWAVSTHYLQSGSHVLKTTNGGSSWIQSLTLDTNINFYSIFFVDSLKGFVGGDAAFILKTTNAGENWIKCAVDSNRFNFFPVMKIIFRSPQIGLAGGGYQETGGCIWRSSDFGNTWAIRDTSVERIWDLDYRDSLSIMGPGSEFEVGGPFIVRSTDGGITWNFKYVIGYWGLANALSYRTPDNIWMSLGNAEKWAVSNDNGFSWDLIQVADSQVINDIQFISDRFGWAVGTNGLIYKYNSSEIGIKKFDQHFPKQFFLSQNYPNPFNPTTKIRFSIPPSKWVRGMDVKLIIYDVLGKEVATLVNQQLKPGTYEVVWNASNYPSGVYFYKYITESFTESKRMVLVK
jgi:photosystem II stability/assembly factor-like uncharacterized protein